MKIIKLFSRRNKNTDNTQSYASSDNAIKTIASIISNNDSVVSGRVNACLNDTKVYFEEHSNDFDERGIDKFEPFNIGEIRWLAMVDALEENRYVCERDWKDELDDFLYFVGELKAVEAKALPLKPEWFERDEDICKWCAVIDEKWKSYGMCLAAIDIVSDSYVLFACENDKLKELGALAELASYRIDYAKNM